MTDTTETTGPHPADGDLVRLLDGETEDPAVEKHLETCDDCRRRCRRIAGWSREVGRALDAADPLVSVRDGRDREADVTVGGVSVPRWAKAAAGVVLLLSGALALEPVRAWVIDQAERMAQRLGLVERTVPGSGAAGGGTSIAFVPEGRRLRIHVETPQAEGALEVVAERGDGRVRASIVDGEAGADGPAPAFAAFPSELRIRNGSGSTASYRVTVPAALDELEIRIGDRRLARLDAEELTRETPRTWPLRVPERGTGARPEND